MTGFSKSLITFKNRLVLFLKMICILQKRCYIIYVKQLFSSLSDENQCFIDKYDVSPSHTPPPTSYLKIKYVKTSCHLRKIW